MNPEQQKAINHSAGPLMIVAGPGSGKTFVIVERVRHLIESGVPQSSILCLTFTNKATDEMRERLEGHEIAEAKIGTFHSFAKEILEENPLESGIHRNTRIIEKRFKMVWCIRNTDRFSLNPEYIEVGRNQSGLYAGMIEAIRTFKQEMISPDDLQRYIGDKLREPESADSVDDETLQSIRQLNEFNKVYGMYEKYLKDKNMIDFEDMVTGAVRLLQKNQVIRSRYQKRFQHILIDEFQDNNHSQMELAKLLGSGGNVTVVGDDDQCIMRFQGAYYGIFDKFQRTYPSYTPVGLGQNYRSSKRIVALADSLIGGIQSRQPKKLFTENEEGSRIMLVRTPTDRGQTEYVAKKIRGMIGTTLKRRDGSDRPISYGDIVILSRRRVDGQRLTRGLRSFGIPTTLPEESDMFASPAVADLLSYLRVAESPDTSGTEIFRLLRRHGMAERNIIAVTERASRKAWNAGGGRHDYVFETLREYGRLEVTQKPEVEEILGQLDAIITCARRSTVVETVYDIMMVHSDVYRRSVQSGTPQDRRNLAMLNDFYKIAEEYQNVFSGGQLSDFLGYVSIIETLEPETEEDTTASDAVNVLTIHKSKGKEFPIVFVTDLADGRFPLKYTEKMFTIPAELLRPTGTLPDSKELHMDEERRLLYVSMTRAMNRLFLVYPVRYEGLVRDKKPSKFLQELDCERNPLIEVSDFAESDFQDAGGENPTERLKARLQTEAAGAINRMHLGTAVRRIVELSRVRHFERHGSLDGFDPADILKTDMSDLDLSSGLEGRKTRLTDRDSLVLSASSINTYSNCPLQYKFQNVLRVPQARGAALDLGNVVHAAAENLAARKAAGEELTPEIGHEAVKLHWVPHSYQNRTEEESMMERAKRMAGRYVEWENASRNELVGTEIRFKVEIDGFKFRGRIDRLERNPAGGYEVVDYKTGKGIPVPKSRVAEDIQLNMYAKAVEKTRGELPAKASLFYLEHDKILEYEITPESVASAVETITGIAEDIAGERFDPTPGPSACRFCRYANICDAKYSG